MALIDDLAVVNNGLGTDFTAVNFDAVGLSSGQPTPNHVEGTDGAWWTLKKDTTGYAFTSTISGTPSMTGRVMVGFINYAFADIVAIPITAIGLRVSSATGFTTNYGEIDALAQIQAPENTPISGHTPVILYEDNATETGTPNYGTVESAGWTATTGGTNDGKQGGFDWIFIIGWIGAHSETFTNTFLSDLRAEYYDSGGGNLPGTTSRPIGVFSEAGDFYLSNIRLQLGHGTSDTANVVVTETGKTVFFNNLHVNHELGWLFVNPSSSHEIRLTLTNCVFFWNDQVAANEIFDGITNVDHFKLDGCSFSRGGNAEMPAHSVNRWCKTTKFDGCGEVDVGDIVFEDNTISNAAGVGMLLDTTGHRVKRTTFVSCSRAMEMSVAGTYALDGDTFDGNTFDLRNSAGAVLVDTSGADTRNTDQQLGNGTIVGVGQSLRFGSSGTLSSCKFTLSKTGTPTGNIVAKLYALNNARGGEDDIPTGAVLATSDEFDVSTLDGTPTVISIQFSDELSISLLQERAITLELATGYTGDGTNHVLVGKDTTTPASVGNMSTLTGSTWSAVANQVAIFAVTRDGIVKVNLTNGANPSTFENTGSPNPGATIIVASASITFSNLIVNSEVRVYEAGTSTEIAGIESTTGTTFNFSVGINESVDYVILGPIVGSVAYVPIRVESISWDGATTVVINQQINRNFKP